MAGIKKGQRIDNMIFGLREMLEEQNPTWKDKIYDAIQALDALKKTLGPE